MKRVLLIEDEPGLVLTLTDRLEAEGFTVSSEADGDKGLERALAEHLPERHRDLLEANREALRRGAEIGGSPCPPSSGKSSRNTGAT